MKSPKTFFVIFTFSTIVSIFVVFFGSLYWNPFESSMHAEIPLENAEQSLHFASVINRSVTYSFDVFWPLRAGNTTINIQLMGVECGKKKYIIKLFTGEGSSYLGVGSSVFRLKRRDPFLYFHLQVILTPGCKVFSNEKDPVVVIDAKSS